MQSNVPNFDDLLAGAKGAAIHLEMRDTYYSNPRFEAWQQGHRVDWNERDSWWHPFHQKIADAADEHARTALPPTSPSSSVQAVRERLPHRCARSG
ncbi:hypothetical protein HRW23_32940 [Streptomyces lunaelactis]|uniref:DUF6879 family protein n=1 Tax=Streptomyces lunaelactis TaxID=1535768 RepID=UPI0015845B7D|nr:DUF6879 family protein [Streptomyces lunaelactis]NUK70465.1 hypothetical protein [Streptomyces lunaelactis]NUK82096.1 hypothetical protein [Streptomyces lunaelactis]